MTVLASAEKMENSLLDTVKLTIETGVAQTAGEKESHRKQKKRGATADISGLQKPPCWMDGAHAAVDEQWVRIAGIEQRNTKDMLIRT